MKTGLRTYQPSRKIDYKQLRKTNPKAARRAVLEYLKASNHNISEAASIFGINRAVVYDIIKKEKEGDLRDRSKVPKRQPRKTPIALEDKVIEVKNSTGLGPARLSRYLKQHEGISIPPGTVRHIIRRNKKKINYHFRSHRVRKEKREFIDWYSAKPFEIVQREKSWTNGLCWYLWVISWLRSYGVKSSIVFTVDNGEEFGGKSWLKVRELRKLISGFGCRLIQNHEGHCEENAHLERSHRTDDDEFYIPRVMAIKSEADLLHEAMGYIYYYNNVREHSALNYHTPFSFLKTQLPDIDDKIRFVIPIMLDKVSVKLGPWSGYNVLAHHPT